ncbi:hypothetical protein EVAR_37052_1 [Eumeta japonica]|uniref:Uncharacterized protein n=1 Tax=Eumeta variegata TaxID=151549 RepID=A0A4C1WIJ4_EUMVA|nr:hypothetical protein EVAR_37052_1 [Eumeta japonica]
MLSFRKWCITRRVVDRRDENKFERSAAAARSRNTRGRKCLGVRNHETSWWRRLRGRRGRAGSSVIALETAHRHSARNWVRGSQKKSKANKKRRGLCFDKRRGGPSNDF